MAASTSRTYTAEDVLALLDKQEIVDELLSTVDLDAESEEKTALRVTFQTLMETSCYYNQSYSRAYIKHT